MPPGQPLWIRVLLPAGRRVAERSVLLKSGKKRLTAFISGPLTLRSIVRSHGFLSVNTLVGIIVQLDTAPSRAIPQTNPWSGNRVDRGFQQNVGPDFCFSANGSSRCGSVCADLQLAFEQWHDPFTVCKDHDHIRRLDSELKIGADASATAGPVGRNAEAGTDILLNSAIYSYSRSKGLFAGVALDGAVLELDDDANKSCLRKEIRGCGRSTRKPSVSEMKTVSPFLTALQKYAPLSNTTTGGK